MLCPLMGVLQTLEPPHRPFALRPHSCMGRSVSRVGHMRAWINADDVEDTPRAVVAIANDYPPSFELEWHRHRRGQLLYAAKGVVVVSTPYGAWVAPPERAVWTPPTVLHSVRMVGSVSTR